MSNASFDDLKSWLDLKGKKRYGFDVRLVKFEGCLAVKERRRCRFNEWTDRSQKIMCKFKRMMWTDVGKIGKSQKGKENMKGVCFP